MSQFTDYDILFVRDNCFNNYCQNVKKNRKKTTLSYSVFPSKSSVRRSAGGLTVERVGAKPTATTAAVADYCVEEIVGEVGGRCQLKQERRVYGNRCDVPARLSRTTNRCDVD